jgi:hypothetical protein
VIPASSGSIAAGSQATENSAEHVKWQQRLWRDDVLCSCASHRRSLLTERRPDSLASGLFCQCPIHPSLPGQTFYGPGASPQSHRPKSQGNTLSIQEKEAISELNASQPNIPPQPCCRRHGDRHTHNQWLGTQTSLSSVFRLIFVRQRVSRHRSAPRSFQLVTAHLFFILVPQQTPRRGPYPHKRME